MAKPKKERSTDHPVGMKLNEVMRQKGIPGDYAMVAREFEVTTQSVYGWVSSGTIGKERYAKLASWSGRPLEWWFGDKEATRYTRTEPCPVPEEGHESERTYDAGWWPFRTVSIERAKRTLLPSDLLSIEAHMLNLIEQREHNSVPPPGSHQKNTRAAA